VPTKDTTSSATGAGTCNPRWMESPWTTIACTSSSATGSCMTMSHEEPAPKSDGSIKRSRKRGMQAASQERSKHTEISEFSNRRTHGETHAARHASANQG
jgi:hypothetical protein